MPNYGFVCENCNHLFEQLLSISDREIPLKDPCPNCKKKKVKRQYDSFSQQIGSDSTLTANKATGGKWNELMTRMKRGTAKRFHKNLDIASSNTGKYWKG
jgi:putative FmdB family regulatory protein